MAKKTIPDAAYLRACFDYDPETGILRWRVRPRHHFGPAWMWPRWNQQWAGTIAGNQRGPIWVATVNCRPYPAHHLIWVLVTGAVPTATIDHRDHNPLNNRWENLREADMSEQNANRRTPCVNKTGFKGVRWRPARNCWRAVIKFRGKEYHIGHFKTAEDAHAAYLKAAEKHHGAFACPE